MRLRTFLNFFTLASTVSCEYVVLEQVRPPKEWTAVGLPDPNAKVILRIALQPPQISLRGLEKTLLGVSDPQNAQYGQFLSQIEVKNLLRASEAANVTKGWLLTSEYGEEVTFSNDEWINLSTTVSRAEILLNSTFQIFRRSTDQLEVVRTLQYSVPINIAPFIDLIHPTTKFPLLKPARNDIFKATILSSFASESVCDGSVIPGCLQELYNVKGFNLSNDGANAGFIGVSGYLSQYANYRDLEEFQDKYSPATSGANFTWTSINGSLLNQTSSSDISEANLDIQYSTSLTFPLPVNFYSTGGLGLLVPDSDEPCSNDNQNEPYLDQLTYLLNLPDDKLPHTLTTSYGEDEQSVPPRYAQKVCNMFGALGLRGVSVIFSSGDVGVGSACEMNDGTNRTRFMVQFPASCPYVTSVGATTSTGPEVATYYSGGGFSERWPRPWWQQNAVVSYLERLGNEKWAGLYNPWGRGVPDVAAQGNNFYIVEKGSSFLISGTSCASPTFASIIALINGLRVQSGQPPLGFLNPWLYIHASSALNDITEGGSTGCTGTDMYSGLPTPYVPYASWNATEGWDPVTGLGTPDFQKLWKSSMEIGDGKGRMRAI